MTSQLTEPMQAWDGEEQAQLLRALGRTGELVSGISQACLGIGQTRARLFDTLGQRIQRLIGKLIDGRHTAHVAQLGPHRLQAGGTCSDSEVEDLHPRLALGVRDHHVAW